MSIWPVFLFAVLIIGGCQPAPPPQQVSKHVPATPWFEDQPVLGSMSADDMAKKLKEIGELDDKAIVQFKAQGSKRDLLLLGPDKKLDVSKITSHQFGFIPQTTNGPTTQIVIQQASLVQADNTLKGSKLRVTLDRLRVAHYPGGGRHNILFTFYAQNQVTGTTEDVNFNQNYEVLEGEGAGIVGYPIFIGLNVGDYGLSFKGHTINVSNDDDEKFLGFLNGDTFTKGMELLDKVNPIVPIVSQFATGIAKAIGSRNKNVGVQDFYMGLDFVGSATGARLSQGSYIAVQAPDEGWNWGDWVFDKTKGQIIAKAGGAAIPYNYVVFAVTKM